MLNSASLGSIESSEIEGKVSYTEVKLANGYSNIRFTPISKQDQTILKLAPTVTDGGVNLSFWSSLSQKNARRPLNIKAHGKNDFFDKNEHVSFYTMDLDRNQPKALEWHWGSDYDAKLKLPTMGLDIMRVYNKATGPTTSPFGLKIRNPTLNATSLERNIGLFIEEQKAGIKTNYSIFSQGGLAYFGGSLGINVKKPSYSLDVKGDASFQGKIFYNGNELTGLSCSNFNFDDVNAPKTSLLMALPYSIRVSRITLSGYSKNNFEISASIQTLDSKSTDIIASFDDKKNISTHEPVQTVDLSYNIEAEQAVGVKIQFLQGSNIGVAISICYQITE